MKILLIFLMLSASLSAQTVYTVTSTNSGLPVTYLNAHGITLSGQGNLIPWVMAGGPEACSTSAPGPTGHGFIFLSIDSVALPCMNVASYTTSGAVTVTSGTFKCTGPYESTTVFTKMDGTEGTLTLQYTYYRARYGCYGQIVSGSLAY